MTRIRQLVDLAYNNDPRIVKFRNEEKEKKQAAKRARMSAIQAQRAEEERIIREAQLAKEKVEQAEQKRIEQIRQEKEQQKRALRKERKYFRDLAKEQNYFSNSDKEKLRNMEGVEKICEMLKIIELQEFNKELVVGGREVFVRKLRDTEERLEEERRALFDPKPSRQISTPSPLNINNNNSTLIAVDKNAIWCNENMQMLIKAVNLFPAGTVQRWEVIANYINQHGKIIGGKKFISRDVLNKAKDIQSSNFTKNSLKAQANENAFESFQKSKKELKIIDNAEISTDIEGKQNTNFDGFAIKAKPKEFKPNENGIDNNQVSGSNNAEESLKVSQQSVSISSTEIRTWTKDEQALLEQAMKTYPLSTSDRWDRIAECIPNRTKKDCLRRVKELVDRVNAKRDAQQTVK